MTANQMDFIRKEIAVWGDDYIYDLLDRGYEPKLTSGGYRWFAPVAPLTKGPVYATVALARLR